MTRTVLTRPKFLLSRLKCPQYRYTVKLKDFSFSDRCHTFATITFHRVEFCDLNQLTMSVALNDTSSGTSQAAVGYFVDQKKGEVNELKQVSNLSQLGIELWSARVLFVNSASQEHQCGTRCQKETRNYQESYCLYDSRHRCVQTVHRHDHGGYCSTLLLFLNYPTLFRQLKPKILSSRKWSIYICATMRILNLKWP